MQTRVLRWCSLLLAALLVLTVTQGSMAQGSGDGPTGAELALSSDVTLAADLGPGFYYQGVLTESGAPVTGNRKWNSNCGMRLVAGCKLASRWN